MAWTPSGRSETSWSPEATPPGHIKVWGQAAEGAWVCEHTLEGHTRSMRCFAENEGDLLSGSSNGEIRSIWAAAKKETEKDANEWSAMHIMIGASITFTVLVSSMVYMKVQDTKKLHSAWR